MQQELSKKQSDKFDFQVTTSPLNDEEKVQFLTVQNTKINFDYSLESNNKQQMLGNFEHKKIKEFELKMIENTTIKSDASLGLDNTFFLETMYKNRNPVNLTQVRSSLNDLLAENGKVSLANFTEFDLYEKHRRVFEYLKNKNEMRGKRKQEMKI